MSMSVMFEAGSSWSEVLQGVVYASMGAHELELWLGVVAR